MRRKKNIFRNGFVHVQGKMCKSCIYLPDTPIPDARDRVEEAALSADTAVVCHDTLGRNEAICRGFFDRHERDTFPLRLARPLGCLKFVRHAMRKDSD